jgi:hypothetical protein
MIKIDMEMPKSCKNCKHYKSIYPCNCCFGYIDKKYKKWKQK